MSQKTNNKDDSTATTAFHEMTSAPMLSNGSNPEGVMPSPAFNWMDKNKSVIVHGPKMSPAVNKIRVYLQYAGIKYKLVTHLPSGIRSGPYTKVPNIDVNGRQMNDSYIILQHICSLIKLPIDLTWEREFVLHLDIGLKLQTSDKDWGKLANKCVGAPCCLQNLIGRKAIGPMERKQGNANVIMEPSLGHAEKDCAAIMKAFKDAMGDNDFVGGTKPGSPDLSLYGVLSNYLAANTDMGEKLMNEGNLNEWRKRMESLIPLDTLF